MTDRTLFQQRVRAHTAFDRLWTSGLMSRGRAYKWLSHSMGIRQENCHFSKFDLAQCYKAEELALEKMRNMTQARSILKRFAEEHSHKRSA